MLKQFKKGLRICIVLAIILTTLPIHTVLDTQGASAENMMDVISFKDEIGYYAKDGKVYRYTQTDQITEAVSVGIAHVESLAYDGVFLYLMSEDMSIHAYDVNTHEIKWEHTSLTKSGKSLGSALFLENGVLHINAYENNVTSILQLQASDGAVVAKSKDLYCNVKGSLPYASGSQVMYSGKDIAFSATEMKYVQLYDETYVTSVYDDVSKQIFAIGEDNALYVSPMDKSVTYRNLTLYKTSHSIVGNQTKATLVDGRPTIFSIEKEYVVLYMFNGVSFEQQTTKIKCKNIANIAFDNGKIYVVDGENNVQSATYTLPNMQSMDANSKQLQADILTFYASVDETVSDVTLEHKAAIDALSTRYQALTQPQQSQILAAAVLEELVAQITTSQAKVDRINAAIASLSTPEELRKEERQKVQEIQTLYNELLSYDKTQVNQNLLRMLDKIEAYNVEDEIAKLPIYANIAVKDLTRVQEILQQYDTLVQEWKKDVQNYATLQRLENRIYELMSGTTLGEAYWSNFGGNKTSSATTNTKTPFTLEDIQSNFKAEGNYQGSIIVDNYIYTIRDKSYLTILDNKGKLIGETKLYGNIGFFSRLAYGDGKIYVALGNRIQAFDAKTLRPLWLSQTGGQFISTITYHNGHIYSGMSSGGGGGTAKTDGYFFAINVKDEDVQNAYEVKDFTWTCGEEKNTGYYWAGAAIVGDAVIFAGDSGELISHHVTQDMILDRYHLGDTKVRANVSYIEAEKAVLVGTQDTQTLFKIKVKEDGSFQKNSIQSINVQGQITGGIAYYNGRAYVPSGGMSAKGFSVVETKNMSLAYRTSEIGSQSYPLISTAYATADNKEEVKVYAIDYRTGDLKVLRDAQGQTVAKMETLAQGYGTYNSGSVTPDAYGNLYICGASFAGGGPLYSIQSKDAKFSITDIENAITNFPADFTYSDKKALQLLLGTYLSMSESEQKQVRNATVLLSYEQRMQVLTHEKLQRIQSIIDSLPTSITIQQQSAIHNALKEYGELLESDQLRIHKYENLQLAEKQLQASLQGFQQLIKDIDAIDIKALSLADQVRINTLLARYEKLSMQERQYITNYDVLLQAQSILKRLADGLEIPDVSAEVDRILVIETLTLDNETAILSLYNRIMKMDIEVRMQIQGYEQFLVVYQSMLEQRAAVEQINDAIWNQIQPLNIQLRDRDAIVDIFARYHQLPLQNKAYITYVEDLLYAKVVIDKMEKGDLAQELFEKIKMANTSYTFETTMVSGAWIEFSFEGADIRSPKDFAFQVSSKSIDEGAIYSLDKHAEILAFAHEGSFPGKVTMRMQTSMADGSYYLYYYNPIKKKAERIQDIEVVDGMTSFSLLHASTYFISAEQIDPLKVVQALPTTDVDTGDFTSTAYLWMSICMSVGILIVLRKKRTS